MKTKWNHTVWARFLAFILAIMVTVGLFACALVVIWGINENWYLEEPDFYESWLCREAVYEDINRVINHFDSDAMDSCYTRYADSNFRFTIRELDPENGRPKATLCADSLGNMEAVHVLDYYFDIYGYDEAEDRQTLTAYELSVYLRDPIHTGDKYYSFRVLFAQLTHFRMQAVIGCGVFLVLLVALYVFLLCSAGHKNGVEGPVLLWQDKIPLDLYLAAVIGVGVLIAAVMFQFVGYNPFATVALLLGAVLLYMILFLALSMTMAARFKVGKWWRSALTWRISCWALRVIRKCVVLLRDLLRKMVQGVSLAWRWALGYLLFCVVGASLAVFGVADGSGFAAFLLLCLGTLGLAVICITALQMKTLKTGGEALARGILDHKVNTTNLYGDFRRHGENLNRINEGISNAVEERIKSERFKTELITNVSHDIKTPLTSIINYIDLLKKEPQDSETVRGYIDVLDRQSQKLKKLTEDVVEASKAAAGVIPVNLAPTDAAELMHQCVGEFAERLEKSRITPLVSAPQTGVQILADGRLLWRVFDNLLQNVCKYALPGTRVYLDAAVSGADAVITLKNISANPLNISSEELMERFVRGDASRSSEGSGLGLSIARSLTELQGGAFDIGLDGDLFKVILRFPIHGDRVHLPPENGRQEVMAIFARQKEKAQEKTEK
ncbi:MAG: sensor histidine kinase [Ruminococcaceae bacterium]|nr:sensor histidine kinase [Oscillospiraceae bacterium]